MKPGSGIQAFRSSPDFALLNPGYEEKKKEAERRKTLFRNLRSLAGCGTAPTFILPRVRGRKKEGAAHLPAFHRGSYRRESSSLRRSSGQASWNTCTKRSGRAAGAVPSCSEHLARRS